MSLDSDKSFKVLSISISNLSNIDGYDEITGIDKLPITESSIEVDKFGIVGDKNKHKKTDGENERAVFILGELDAKHWQAELVKEIRPGTMGENIIISNMDTHDFFVNDRLVFPNVTLEAKLSRTPCHILAAQMQDKFFPKKYLASGHTGVFFRVVKEGSLAIGDEAKLDKSNSSTTNILQAPS